MLWPPNGIVCGAIGFCFVGDDENDEDAFALAGNVVPVRIGRKQRSHARYYLRTQTEIDELFDLLVRLRRPVRPVSAK